MYCNNIHNSLTYGTFHGSHSCTTTKKPVVCTTTTKKPVVCTTTTKKPVVCTTTTKKPVVCTTTTKKPAVCVTTTKQPAVCVTTTKKPAVCVTATTKKPVIVTTTTKKPVVITTTTKKPVVTTTKKPVTTTRKPVTTTRKPIPVHQCAHTYTVRQGDTLFNIANSRGTDLTMIRKLNPNIKDLNKISINQKVCIPKPLTCKGYYAVKAGDTLTKIAKLFSTDLNTMKKLNPYISNYDLIYPGQRLCVPVLATTKPITTTTKPITTTKKPDQCAYTYTVKKGDTLFEIANARGTDVATLSKLNPNIKDVNMIYVDQKVCVPKPQGCTKYYIVKSGDTLTNIAKGLGTDLNTMKRLNPDISNYDLIYPNQRLCAP